MPLSAFLGGIILMLFIYWGWDTAVSVNEETKDTNKTPAQAAIISTVLLLVTYAIVIISSVVGVRRGRHEGDLAVRANQAHGGDVLSVLGGAIFGSGGFGTVPLLLAASDGAQRLPRPPPRRRSSRPAQSTTLSMGVYKALPTSFAKIHRKYLTPTVSTLVMGGVSIVLYVVMNYISGGNVIYDAVTAIGIYIASYYGLTALTCVWYYRRNLRSSARNLWMQGILPVLGGLILGSSAAGASTWTGTWLVRSRRPTRVSGALTPLADRRRLRHRVHRGW